VQKARSQEGKLAQVVQIWLQDTVYAEQLCQSLSSDPTFEGCRIQRGESAPTEGVSDHVRVVDLSNLLRLPQPLANPAKTVVIASGAVDLERVWEAGIVSVLQNSESLEYVKLAILAALLRPSKSAPMTGSK